MKPNILICGKTGAGKTSLIKALTHDGVVPDNAIGHAKPTTKGFVVYETEVANFIDAEGMEPGMTVDQYADFILEEMQTRIESGDCSNVITSILYCIDGSGGRVQDGDIKLVKTLDKRLHVVVTKMDIMRKEQIENINKQLLTAVDAKNIFMISSAKSSGLSLLLNSIKQKVDIALEANADIAGYNARWNRYYRQKNQVWEAAVSEEADSFIHWAAGRAAAIALIPLPLADVAPLVANELYMIYKIGNLYGYAVTGQIVTMLTGVAGGSFGGKLLASFLPGLKIPIAAGITYGVGKAAKAYFASGMKLDEDELKEEFKQAEKESKKTNWENETVKE